MDLGNVAIQYPVALNDLNDLVRIKEAPNQRGLRYSCVHCGNRMSAVVLVTQRKPHFRHTKSSTCDPDSALHATAIEIIRNAQRKAQSQGNPYLLTRPCHSTWGEYYNLRRCPQNATEIDLGDGWQSKTEESIVEGTRSDLVFFHDDGQQVIIEVVNTHSMEQETENAYRKSGIPVVVVRVEWEIVDRLWQGIHTHESRNFASDECDGCKSERLKAEADFKRRCTIVDRELAKMKRQRFSRPKFRPFYECRPYDGPKFVSVKPTPMFMKTQRKVFANAIILTELGFVQSNPDKKPWLFTKTIRRTPKIILYADLGGSALIPIYENTATLLYTSLEFEGPLKDPDMNAYIVKKFGERLQNEGVQVRISLYKQIPFIYPFELIDFESIDTDPESRVNSRILGSLLRSIYPAKR